MNIVSKINLRNSVIHGVDCLQIAESGLFECFIEYEYKLLDIIIVDQDTLQIIAYFQNIRYIDEVILAEFELLYINGQRFKILN